MGAGVIAVPGGRPAQGPVMSENSLGIKHTVVTYTFSGSYATGGDSADFQAAGGVLGRATPLAVFVTPTSGGFVPAWDSVNKKMKLFQQSAATSALTEVANASNQSAVVATCLVVHT
jgi:hypothetical protein